MKRGVPRVAATTWHRLLARWRRPLLGELAALRPGSLAAFLFEYSGSGLLAVDRGLRVVRANTATRVLCGGFADGAAVLALFMASERDVVAAELAASLRGQPARPLFGSVLLGGAAVGVTAAALRERDGSVSLVLLRLTDLSVQRELEAQLAQAQKLQSMGQLAGGIAHDFNNLLTAVTGAAETVAARCDLPAEVADDVAQIRASAGRGAALVRQLLAFGRQQTLQPLVLDVADLVADISGLLRRLLGSAIRLELDLEQPGGRVRADPTQLDQVLVNLAVNARDAMPEGGTLIVRTGHLTLHRARASGAEMIQAGRYVMIEVADTGSGIAPDILPRIFDPFFTTRRDSGGTGLGLSTVHGIVRQSDGFLEVTSEKGQGTSIRVYLPRWDDLAVSIPHLPIEQSVAPAVSRRGTVLLVDDEEPVRRLAERALSRAGWEVIAAEGGEEALAAIGEQTASRLGLVGIVTDMVMHGMDGVQVVRAVRERLAVAGLPALLVSGYADAALRDALAGEADVAFLAKPYALRELVEAFAAVVAAAGPRSD